MQKWLFNTEMVIYLIWSEQLATWPIFPLSSHNDLQTSICNMASSKNIAQFNAEMSPSCFEDSYWPIQIWYMPLQTVHTSQSLFSRKIVEIEHFALRAAAGGGLEESEKNSPWVVLTLIQGSCPDIVEFCRYFWSLVKPIFAQRDLRSRKVAFSCVLIYWKCPEENAGIGFPRP